MTCTAKLWIGDDYGDNHATMTCQLDEGHEGPHRENYGDEKAEGPGTRNVIVTWEGDDSYLEDDEDPDIRNVEDLVRDLPPEGSPVS